MSDAADKHKSEKWAQRIAGGVTAMSVIFAAAVHIANFLPDAYSKLFPHHDIRLLGMNSKERILIANRGDYDYFLSHLRYGPDYRNLPFESVTNYAEELVRNNSLRDMCAGKVQRTGSNLASQDCDDRIEKVKTRLNMLQAEMSRVTKTGNVGQKVPECDNQDAVIDLPGFKNRGVADVLLREVTRQFDIKDEKWGKCPVVANANEQQWEQLLAFWLTTYQTIPGHCTKLEFYYARDRNFRALWSSHPGVNFIPAVGSLHYYSMNKKDDGTDETCKPPPGALELATHAHNCKNQSSDDCSVHPSCLDHKPLPALLGVMHYNDSQFCTSEIKKLTGFEGIPRSGDTDCLLNK